MEQKNLKIDIMGFFESTNLGDPVIGETAKYLVNKICEGHNLKANVNLHSLYPIPTNSHWITKYMARNTYKVSYRKFYKKFLVYIIFRLYSLLPKKFNIYKQYYSEILKDSNLVVFGGGGMIKYVSEAFFISNYYIIKYCKKHNIPIIFNAVGVEGYDNKDIVSRLLKQILNEKCISSITTRDDYISLQKYKKEITKDSVVGDPALWSNSVYQPNSKQDLIGIGVIRSGIFSLNGFKITSMDVVKFYCEMIRRLEADGYKWQLFTNGTKSDEKMAAKILKHLKIKPNEQNKAERPTTTQQLINIITQYKGIVANRMHSHIIATSFDIPTIGLIWNEKLKWYAKHLDAEDRFFYPAEMNNYDKIYEAFKTAMSQGNSKLNTESLKQKTFKTLEKSILDTLLV